MGNVSVISLVWTTLPVVLMAVYRLGWDAIVNATAERQPYIDLNRSEAGAYTADRTVMMDYRSYPFLNNWLVAFRKKQYLISSAMILSTALSVCACAVDVSSSHRNVGSHRDQFQCQHS